MFPLISAGLEIRFKELTWSPCHPYCPFKIHELDTHHMNRTDGLSPTKGLKVKNEIFKDCEQVKIEILKKQTRERRGTEDTIRLVEMKQITKIRKLLERNTRQILWVLFLYEITRWRMYLNEIQCRSCKETNLIQLWMVIGRETWEIFPNLKPVNMIHNPNCYSKT